MTSNKADAARPLEIRTHDHICLIGNELADRMQHHGWLETLIHAKFPDADLVFRNLAAAGDEVATWHRSENFGSRDEWLAKTKADVIFAFYGFNESFQGCAGLGKFKQDLEKFLKETKTKNYSGKGAPRMVAILADRQRKKLEDPNLARSSAEQLRTCNSTPRRWRKSPRRNEVPFVDLFAISQKLYDKPRRKKQSLTFDSDASDGSG